MLSRALEMASYLDPTSTIDSHLESFTPTQLIIGSIAGYLFITHAHQAYYTWNTQSIKKKLADAALKTLTKLPRIGPLVQAQIDSEIVSIANDLQNDIDKKRIWKPLQTLTSEGLTLDAIRARFTSLQINYHNGKTSGAVYVQYDDELLKLLEEIWGETALTNPMHATEWPLINQMKAEIISMCHELLNSPLNKYIKRLQEVKKTLATLEEESINSRPSIKNQYTILLTEKNALLNDETNQTNLEYKKKEINKRIKQFRNESMMSYSGYQTYQRLLQEQTELETKTTNPGIITHGGSTSIFEACKAYVNAARKVNISRPVILAPASIHVAFDKACETLNVQLVKIPLNKTGQVDIVAMEQMIRFYGKNIAVMVGSAPSFTYGILDPIAALGALAIQYKIPLHIDACLGGFLTVFAKKAGINLPVCDFSIDGITSISIDTHKYGKTPKGTSVLVFHPACKARTTHVHLDWDSMYVTEGIDGSRSGADIATAWATLHYYGETRYINDTRKIVKLREEIENAIEKIEGLELAFPKYKQNKLNVVGIKAKPHINLLIVEHYLHQHNWSIQIMQTPDQQVDGLHFCLTSVHTANPDFTKEFTKALADGFEFATRHPFFEAEGNIKVYGKFKAGVPSCIQQEIGERYIGKLNTLRI